MKRTLNDQAIKWLSMTGVVLSVGLASSGLAATAVTPLTGDEQTWLTFMREEEKVARDAYLTFYEVWNLRSFQNIAKSEQTHMNAIKRLLVRYGVTDPVTDDTAGIFANPELQALYDTLIARGSLSMTNALEVGVLIEEADIADLTEAAAATTHRDLLTVYKNLLNGSKSHLKAFTKTMTLTPQTAPTCTGICADRPVQGTGKPGTCSAPGTGTCSDTGTGTRAGKKTGTCSGAGCITP